MHLFTRQSLLTISVFCCLIIAACNSSRKIQFEEHEAIDEAFRQDFERTKDLTTGTIPRERLLAAIERENELFSFQGQNRAVGGIAWEERGPNNVGGRIRAVMVDKRDASNKKVWVGGVGGGIWHTDDITATVPVWIKANDFLDNMAIIDIVQDPTTLTTLYAGTGEGFFNGGAQKGLGIFKSTDGGDTWTSLAATTIFEYVQDLQFDKNGKLYAAVRTDGTATTANCGIMRSANGGNSWTQVLVTPTASSTRGCDLEISKDGDLYATTGIFSNGGIYKSVAGATAGDAGTWINITPNPTTGAIEAPNNQWARIKLAASPSDNNILYAVFQGGASGPAVSQNACRSIQQYNAGTNTWTVRTVPKIIDQNSVVANYPVFTREGGGGQGWYDLTAAVDPNNSAVLVVSGIDACKSQDNGATWSQISCWTLGTNEQAAGFTSDQIVHADQHNFVFVGGSSSTSISATDGGIYYSTNINTAVGKPIFTAKNKGLNVTQLYAVAMPSTAGSNYFLDGAQDNGSHQFLSAGLNNVTQVTGGDGAFCHISASNANNQITSYVYNNYYISTNGGSSFATAAASNGRGSFINPTDYDGSNLYGGDNAGSFFRWTNPQGNTATGTNITVANFSGGNVTHVFISNLTANRVYFGLDNGSVVRVNNANTANVGVVTGTPRAGSVSCIAHRESNEDSMLVSYSNYGGNKIYVSANGTAGAATFTNVTGNLPDMPVRWIMFDPRSHKMAIAATELGVWSCDDITAATPQWNITSSGLARVRVDMLKYRSSDRTIVAATHGRGIFSAKIPLTVNPEVNYSIGSVSTEERKSYTNNTCRYYTDYEAALTINGGPSATATVNITVAGGTATEGKDFDILINNVVTKQLTIAAGATDSKSFIIRIYDDAIAESTETLSLGLTASGGGSSVGSAFPTMSVTIADNDVIIAAATTPVTSQVGPNADQSTVYSPFFGNNSSDAKFQTVFLASELTAIGMVAGSNITEASINIATKSSTAAFNNFNIRLGHTTEVPSGGSGFLGVTGLVNCYSNASYITAVGAATFPFSTAFVWDGTSNVIMQYCFDNTTNFAGFDNISAKADALGVGLRTSVIAASNAAANLSGCTTTPTSSFFPTSARPVTSFKHFKPATPIETATGNTSDEFLIAATSTYDFFTANGKALAKISNTSQDLGCVSTSLLSAGNGVNTSFFSGQRSNKVWTITPTTNTSTTSYTITLYMTTAELAGANPSTFKIYKSTAATIAGANISNTTVATTLVSQNADYTSFTASFTGFSIFFIGTDNIVLPLYYSNFTGERNGNTNVLSWKHTSTTIDKYEVERSLDGIHFTKFSSINYAYGNPIYGATDDYYYSGVAYYRLKIFLPGGSYFYSYVISLSAGNNKKINIYPSPAKSYVVVSLPDRTLINTYMYIADVNGSVIRKVLLTGPQQQVVLDNLSSGMYYFKFSDNSVQKIIKE